MKIHSFPVLSSNVLSSQIMSAFCFQRDFGNIFTIDFSGRNWTLSHSSKHLVTDFCKFSISMLMDFFCRSYWKVLRDSKFCWPLSKMCLTGSVKIASYVNGRSFWARLKSFARVFKLPFSPTLSKLIQVALLKQHLSCLDCCFKNRKALKSPKIYSFSNFEQMLLDWGSAFFACSL